jgi:hypothetical protein
VEYSRSWYRDPEKDDGGYSLERIAFSPLCEGAFNWMASNAEKGGTPGEANNTLNADTVGFELIDFFFTSSQSLHLIFNTIISTESLDQFELEITPPIAYSASIFEGQAYEISIDFTEPPEAGLVYEFSISGLISCTGSTLEPYVFNTGRGRMPTPGELLFSEIMPDPVPSVNLPEVEYIEIKNQSEDILSLDSVRICDLLNCSNHLNGVIYPGAYLLLVSSSAEDFYRDSKTVANLPSLNNAGEILYLSQSDELLDIIEYEENWWRNTAKDGHSLERLDFGYRCQGRINWSPSLSENGGTPGEENSVTASVPDHFGPQLEEASMEDANQMYLDFNEIILTSEMPVITLDPKLEFSAKFKLSTPARIVLDLLHAADTNVIYQIEVSDLSDCNRNTTPISRTSVIVPDIPAQLKINEILFNPLPGGVDFLELINLEDQYVQLKGVTMVNERDTIEIQETIIIEPDQIVALTEDKALLISQYPMAEEENIIEVRNLPALPNESQSLSLRNQRNELLDTVYYHEDFHSALLADVEGVSLERLDLNQWAWNQNHWISASSQNQFATPGASNSQQTPIQTARSTIEINPRVFVPGAGNLGNANFTTIGINEAPLGSFGNVTIFNQSGQIIKNLQRGGSFAAQRFIKWDGTNERGEMVRSGIYLVLVEVYDQEGNKRVAKETVVVGF